MNTNSRETNSTKGPSACANKLRVFSDTNRLGVLRALLDGPLHVGEINERMQIDQSLLSHHLRVLRDAGFVRATRNGKAVLYSLVPEVVVVVPRKGIDLGCCQLAFDQDFFEPR